MSANESINPNICPKCSNPKCKKNGFIHGRNQRYYCKLCNFNFTTTTDLNYKDPKTKPDSLRKLVMKLYLKGNSYRDIEDITDRQVSRQTVLRWVKKGGLKSNKNK
jgi:transposase-like protein